MINGYKGDIDFFPSVYIRESGLTHAGSATKPSIGEITGRNMSNGISAKDRCVHNYNKSLGPETSVNISLQPLSENCLRSAFLSLGQNITVQCSSVNNIL